MDTSKIMRPDDLPFPVTDDVRRCIEDLIAAWDRDDRLYLDCYLDELHAAARSLTEEQDRWIRKYYIQGGWRTHDGTR